MTVPVSEQQHHPLMSIVANSFNQKATPPSSENQFEARASPVPLAPPPTAKKLEAEEVLRHIKAQAAAWDDAAQAELDCLQEKQKGICVELDAKIQLAEEAARKAEQEARRAREHLELCRTTLAARRLFVSQQISMVEEQRRNNRSDAGASIRAAQDRIDEACLRQMAHDAIVNGGSA